MKQLTAKYRISVPTIYKWRRRTDFGDRPHTPKNPRMVLSPFEQHLICEVRKSTGLSIEDLIHVLKVHVPLIGLGNVYRLLVREKLNRNEYLLTEREKAKPRRFRSYPPGYLHIDIKHLPKVDKIRHYLFVAADRSTRLVTIGIYPKSGIKEAVEFLRHCVDFFEFPISYVLTGHGTCFTDRFQKGRRTPSGKHLFDKACKEHSIHHRLTRASHPQTAGMVESFNRKVNQILKPIYFKDRQTLMETLHGHVNNYNRRQTQPAFEGLTPLDHWKQRKEKEAKLKD